MATIKLRRGTAAQWVAANPILADGEVGVESADGTAPDKAKIGDGVTSWTGLSYSISSDWIPLAEMGIAGGVATLDVDGMVPLAQLPDQAALDAEITAAVDAEATLRTDADAAEAAARVLHEGDTTGVHGIADTSTLSLTGHDHLGSYVALDTLTASGKGFVNHGATAGTARPSGYASIEWFGSVEPTNAIDGDSWITTAAP